MPNNPNEKIRSTREEVGDNAIFNEAFRVLNEVRRKHGELLTVITPEVQAGTIYGNPEVFELFNRLEGLDVEEYEFLSGVVEEYISPDNTIVVLGSGWGMMSRGLARNRPDTKIVNVDINDEILSLDRQANQRSGFPNISSIHGDVTKIDDLESLIGKEPSVLAVVGLMRYLNSDQRRQAMEILNELCSKDGGVVIREVNYPSMRDCARILTEDGVPFEAYTNTKERMKYTAIFFLYFMYHKIEPIPSLFEKEGIHFDFNKFKESVDRAALDHPEFNGATREAKSLDDQEHQGDLRYLMVLADLAGKDLKTEYVIAFGKARESSTKL